VQMEGKRKGKLQRRSTFPIKEKNLLQARRAAASSKSGGAEGNGPEEREKDFILGRGEESSLRCVIKRGSAPKKGVQG